MPTQKQQIKSNPIKQTKSGKTLAESKLLRIINFFIDLFCVHTPLL